MSRLIFFKKHKNSFVGWYLLISRDIVNQNSNKTFFKEYWTIQAISFLERVTSFCNGTCLTFPRKPCPVEILLSLPICFASMRARGFPWLFPKLEPTGNMPQLGREALVAPGWSGTLSMLAWFGFLGALLCSIQAKLPRPEGEETILWYYYQCNERLYTCERQQE